MRSSAGTLVDGIPIRAISLPAALEFIASRTISGGPFGLVATVNLDFLRLARRDAGFRAILTQGTVLNLADGWPVRLLAQSGGRHAYRTTGADLVSAMVRDPVIAAGKVFLLGDTEGTLEAVRRRGEREQWSAAIAGTASPSRPAIDNPDCSRAIVKEINASGARVLLVALGAPRQEKWMDRWRHELEPSIGMGVGAAFRFLADPAARAPRLVQAAGMEWAWRLAREPRRLAGRYAGDAVEFVRLLMERTTSD